MSFDLGRRRRLRAFGRRLGLKATAERGCELLDLALTHDSYAAECAEAASNERLEFLGDAVIGAVVAHVLYAKHANEAEGRLSTRRAALVSRAALAASCERLGVGPLLRLGKGEAAAGGASRPSILAAAFEAIVGAIYLSEGFRAARRFVEREHLATTEPEALVDAKSALQEHAQARYKRAPAYRVTAESGPAHARVFTSSVTIGETLLGTGSGLTKKQAEVAAAREALRALGLIDGSSERGGAGGTKDIP